MDRRYFIKLSSAITTSALLSCGSNSKKAKPKKEITNIEIANMPDYPHIIFNGKDAKSVETINTNILIVGAGIAGLSAAVKLKDKKPILLELGDMVGGSAIAQKINGHYYSQGAHYELDFPDNYGKETLTFLSEQNLIHKEPGNKSWSFVDKQFYIKDKLENQSDIYGERMKELPILSAKFKELILSYNHRLPMPTTIIDSKLHDLNKISFEKLLDNLNIKISKTFKDIISYQMIDDYGAGISDVSALAGLHYYACRPYYTDEVNVFSPPEGNFYFANKLLNSLDKNSVHLNSLVTKINKVADTFEVKVFNIKKNLWIKYKTNKIIYAGQKHALKYIHPPSYDLFKNNQYAPWMAINFHLSKNIKEPFWQNDYIGEEKDFLGFVNSQTQYSNSKDTILTAYICLPVTERSLLLKYSKNAKEPVNKIGQLIGKYLNIDLIKQTKKAFVRLHGHGMPIPTTDYLFKDANDSRPEPKIIYAGVDNFRLPLFFEAVDSGLSAINHLTKIS
ncbi:MAG: hypothetical protein COA79_00940 [Planctomycetota bacterium]|nr:MAG: hypothetical protein COA79_00940 [Planctomycetota bacterium]